MHNAMLGIRNPLRVQHLCWDIIDMSQSRGSALVTPTNLVLNAHVPVSERDTSSAKISQIFK